MSNPIRKALDAPSRANAVRGYCYWCQNGDITDTSTLQSMAQRVRECHIAACPLWPVRPYRAAPQRAEDLAQAACYDDHDRILAAAHAKPANLRLAIQAKCWDCAGRAADPGPKLRVRDCEHTDCPIYPVRPWKSIKGRGGAQEAP